MSVEFSAAELAELSSKIEVLTQQLASLDAALGAQEQPDENVEQLLATVNSRIFELRQHWRSMLQLPPPRPVR